MVEEMEKLPKPRSVERKIYFYKFTCIEAGDDAPIKAVFDTYIDKLNGDSSKLEERGLAIPDTDKFQFLDLRKHREDDNIYYGWFYNLRNTNFPYLFNIVNGNRQAITSDDDDTLMEQPHFYCYLSQRLIVSEFNFYGAKMEQLGQYFCTIMRGIYPSRRYLIEILPIIIPDYYKKIVNCKSISKLQFKVANPGLQMLEKQGIMKTSNILY
jgi:hypothetical protein